MGSSAGRRSAAYVRARTLYQTGAYLCHVCGQRPGTSVDHVPPLHTAPHYLLWRGDYLPACLPCQHKEGGTIRANHTRKANPTWQW